MLIFLSLFGLCRRNYRFQCPLTIWLCEPLRSPWKCLLICGIKFITLCIVLVQTPDGLSEIAAAWILNTSKAYVFNLVFQLEFWRGSRAPERLSLDEDIYVIRGVPYKGLGIECSLPSPFLLFLVDEVSFYNDFLLYPSSKAMGLVSQLCHANSRLWSKVKLAMLIIPGILLLWQ